MASSTTNSSSPPSDLRDPKRYITNTNASGQAVFSEAVDPPLAVVQNLGGTLTRLGYLGARPPADLNNAVDVSAYVASLSDLPAASRTRWQRTRRLVHRHGAIKGKPAAQDRQPRYRRPDRGRDRADTGQRREAAIETGRLGNPALDHAHVAQPQPNQMGPDVGRHAREPGRGGGQRGARCRVQALRRVL